MKRASLLLSCFVFWSLGASATGRQVQPVSTESFRGLQPDQLSDSKIAFNYDVVPFTDWAAEAPTEKVFLSLYRGYTEPTVSYIKYGMPHQRVEHLTIFTSRMKTVVDKAPGKIDLGKFLKIETVRQFDPEMQHKPIGPDQIISKIVAEHRPITSFQWCNSREQAITRPRKETDLSYINPPGRAWCSDKSNSLCLESCYVFGDFWSNAVHLVNLSMNADEQKDYGFATQSEIRKFQSEKELGASIPIQKLTGVSTPMTGALEQNMFYFNQLIEYAKVLAVFQNDPNDSNKTVLTAYFVVALKSRTYNKNKMVPMVLLGQFPGLNRGTGITAGLPIFTQTKFEAITQALER